MPYEKVTDAGKSLNPIASPTAHPSMLERNAYERYCPKSWNPEKPSDLRVPISVLFSSTSLVMVVSATRSAMKKKKTGKTLLREDIFSMFSL